MNKLTSASMILRLALYDFKSRYAGSVLGVLWATAEPFVTVLVYWFVYTVALGASTPAEAPYYLWLSAGLAPWLFVSEGIKGVTAVFRDYAFLVKKTKFDKALLPCVRAVSALIPHLIFLTLVCIMCAIEGLSPKGLVYLPVALAAGYLTVLSLGGILALLCARVKDVAQGLNIALNIGFWVTPVFWNGQDAEGIAEALVRFNPFAVLVNMYRSIFLQGRITDINGLLYLLAVCAVLLVLNKALTKALLPLTADRL